MTDSRDKDGQDLAGADNGARLKFQGIVERSEELAGAPPWREPSPDAGAPAPPRRTRRGARWNAASRQTMLVTRLMAVFLFFAVILGWPIGDVLAYRKLHGSFDGWSYFRSFDLGTFLLAVFVPMLTILVGYIMSRQQQMMSAAEDIAAAAREFIHPDQNAAENAISVGAVVRGQMEALNVGLDGALSRLAAVEAMIRQHVEAIETAGASMESHASGAVTRIADERTRLIELTEYLNSQADAFANAIAEKAQASVRALHSADDIAERAESQLEERLRRLDEAAQIALQSFNALREALAAADESVRAQADAIEASAERTRIATEKATKASEAAAEAAARNAANIGAAAERASAEAKAAAEAAIEAAAREAERASQSAYQAAEREAQRVSEAASKVLSGVQQSTSEVLSAVAENTGKAAKAAEEMAASARSSVDAATKASAEVAKASEDARRHADEALAKADETSMRIEERNRTLAEARRALEEENSRLEGLIEEQRKRADRLADAIATQTERLSRLAESQLREQEASARLAAAQAALRAREEAAAEAAKEEADRAARAKADADRAAAAAQAEADRKAAEDARIAAERKAAAEAEAAAEAKAAAEAEKARAQSQARAREASPRSEPAPDPLELSEARRRETVRSPRTNGARLDEVAEKIAPKKRGAERKEPPLTLGDSDRRAEGETDRRSRQERSWREILDATDSAEPLDLAAASSSEPQPQNDGAAKAIRIISELQNFTFDLETRLYGDPPPALRERFERGDRNVFANRILRLNEADVKRRIRAESGRDKAFERDIHEFLQGFERLLEDATTSETADEDLEEYLSSPLGRVYLLIGATVGYFA
ncbi:MAG: hypothetical protein GC153_05430 [Alphaproteobacteria bacterium]|nr:hypothetical protein [Alphaproteobacteria bacterium]